MSFGFGEQYIYTWVHWVQLNSLPSPPPLFMCLHYAGFKVSTTTWRLKLIHVKDTITLTGPRSRQRRPCKGFPMWTAEMNDKSHRRIDRRDRHGYAIQRNLTIHAGVVFCIDLELLSMIGRDHDLDQLFAEDLGQTNWKYHPMLKLKKYQQMNGNVRALMWFLEK